MGRGLFGRACGGVVPPKEETVKFEAQLEGECFEGGVCARRKPGADVEVESEKDARAWLLRSETQVFGFESPLEKEAGTPCTARPAGGVTAFLPHLGRGSGSVYPQPRRRLFPGTLTDLNGRAGCVCSTLALATSLDFTTLPAAGPPPPQRPDVALLAWLMIVCVLINIRT